MAKKKTTKKTVKKTAKKTTRKVATTAEVKPRTKTQLFGAIAEDTGIARKDVALVFESMNSLIRKDIGRRGCGTFTVPGLMKIVKTHKPRRAARKGINPFTGEEAVFKAKPAHNVVKVRALKNLKDMV